MLLGLRIYLLPMSSKKVETVMPQTLTGGRGVTVTKTIGFKGEKVSANTPTDN
jgi:hypothetical protein